MSTVTIGVSNLDTMFGRAKAAFQGVAQGAHISFETVEDLWKTLTPRRWALIRAMAGKGLMSTRAAGRLIGQDIKTVHADVQALLRASILEKDAAGPQDRADEAQHQRISPASDQLTKSEIEALRQSKR